MALFFARALSVRVRRTPHFVHRFFVPHVHAHHLVLRVPIRQADLRGIGSCLLSVAEVTSSPEALSRYERLLDGEEFFIGMLTLRIHSRSPFPPEAEAGRLSSSPVTLHKPSAPPSQFAILRSLSNCL